MRAPLETLTHYLPHRVTGPTGIASPCSTKLGRSGRVSGIPLIFMATAKSCLVNGSAYIRDIFLATKLGMVVPEDGDLTAAKVDSSLEYVPKALDKSLSRLGLNYVDLHYIHRINPNTPIEETMMALKGVVGYALAPPPSGAAESRPLTKRHLDRARQSILASRKPPRPPSAALTPCTPFRQSRSSTTPGPATLRASLAPISSIPARSSASPSSPTPYSDEVS